MTGHLLAAIMSLFMDHKLKQYKVFYIVDVLWSEWVFVGKL